MAFSGKSQHCWRGWRHPQSASQRSWNQSAIECWDTAWGTPGPPPPPPQITHEDQDLWAVPLLKCGIPFPFLVLDIGSQHKFIHKRLVGGRDIILWKALWIVKIDLLQSLFPSGSATFENTSASYKKAWEAEAAVWGHPDVADTLEDKINLMSSNDYWKVVAEDPNPTCKKWDHFVPITSLWFCTTSITWSALWPVNPNLVAKRQVAASCKGMALYSLKVCLKILCCFVSSWSRAWNTALLRICLVPSSIFEPYRNASRATYIWCWFCLQSYGGLSWGWYYRQALAATRAIGENRWRQYHLHNLQHLCLLRPGH